MVLPPALDCCGDLCGLRDGWPHSGVPSALRPASPWRMAVRGRVAAKCRRLAGEIQEMLQLANLRSVSKSSLRWVELDVADTIRWCVSQVRALAEERGVGIEEDIRAGRALAVEDHMKMLFSNILSNAVTHSNRRGMVRVECVPVPQDGPLVTIEDHGLGIPANKLPHIFDEYYRTSEAVRHNKESSGLGLAIVRHVAETHGIRVRVESRPGVGTKFILKSPPSETYLACEEKGRRLKMVYLLIVDDDEDFASAAAKILRDEGHEVRVDLDTRSAVANMEQRRPDLLILDVMFPENNTAGFDLARTMRYYHEKLKDIPVIMLTAVNTKFPLGFSERDIDGHWLPVADFLEKPVDLDVLCNRVAKVIRETDSSRDNMDEATGQ